MKIKKLLRGTLAVGLSFLLATQALAAVVEHDISMGDLNITQENVNADGYKVTGSSEGYTITVEDGVTAEIELEDVTIRAGEWSAIDIQGEADVTLKLKGENTLTSDNDAVIHVTDGSLTITSDEKGSLSASNENEEELVEHAAIGTREGESFYGSITIGGNAGVNAYSDNDGAAIGTGQGEVESIYDEELGEWVTTGYWGGNMRGSITICDDAVVDAYSDDDGAGIGSGLYGDMSGSITIEGSAQVKASSEEDGPGIGSGEDGDMTGTITIQGKANVEALADETGAGIGSGEGGDMDGTIIIDGDASVKASSGKTGAGIGSGAAGETGYYDENDEWIVTGYEGGNMGGTIIIGGDVDASTAEGKNAIGAGDNGEMTGVIIFKKPERPLVERLWNEAGDICAAVRGENTPQLLLESGVDGETLAQLSGGESVLRACSLKFSKDFDGRVNLRFELGETESKWAEVRWLEAGKVVSRTLLARDGLVEFSVKELGDFVIVAK